MMQEKKYHIYVLSQDLIQRELEPIITFEKASLHVKEKETEKKCKTKQKK